MKRLLCAIQFLTIIPVPTIKDERSYARSAVFFPVVGLLLGAIALVADTLLRQIMPSGLASGCVIALLVCLTGGLHLDGLADTADAFFSHRDRDRMLEIMRDPRCGPMGVIAIVLVLVLKVQALSAVSVAYRSLALLTMPVAGRVAQVVFLKCLPYARRDGGLASSFHSGARWVDVSVASLWLFVVPMSLFSADGAIVACASGILICILAVYVQKKLGGATGDVMGAATEVVELVPLVGAAMLSFA